MSERLRLSRDAARAELARLPAILSGREPDPTGLVAPLKLRLGVIALSFIKEDFERKARGQAGESTPPWKPLSPATVRGRRKGRGQGAPEINRDTGVLFNSLSPGAAGNILEITARGVAVGSNVAYAGFVHARRPLWPDWDQWPQRWKDTLTEELAKGTQEIALALLRGAAR